LSDPRGHADLAPGVRAPFCLLVEIARKAGHLPLGTFDRALARLDGVQQI
jgi:hypothetical protein